jgi:hypothetical protein
MRQTACARRSFAGKIGGGTWEGATMPSMRRREFVSLLGGPTGWPLAARAADGDAGDWDLVARRGASRAASHGVVPVRQLGFVEGQNVAIEYIDELFYRALADGIREAPCFGPSTTTTAPISTRL